MIKIEPQDIEQFNKAVEDHPAALADFFKDNCPGCKMLDASLAKLTGPEFADLVLIKAKLEILGEDFFKGLGLRQTPTLIAFRDGKETGRLAGFTTPANLQKWISEQGLI